MVLLVKNCEGFTVLWWYLQGDGEGMVLLVKLLGYAAV